LRAEHRFFRLPVCIDRLLRRITLQGATHLQHANPATSGTDAEVFAPPQAMNHELADEAKVIVVLAFRNGPIEAYTLEKHARRALVMRAIHGFPM
jgi:hypothetical protein